MSRSEATAAGEREPEQHSSTVLSEAGPLSGGGVAVERSDEGAKRHGRQELAPLTRPSRSSLARATDWHPSVGPAANVDPAAKNRRSAHGRSAPRPTRPPPQSSCSIPSGTGSHGCRRRSHTENTGWGELRVGQGADRHRDQVGRVVVLVEDRRAAVRAEVERPFHAAVRRCGRRSTRPSAGPSTCSRGKRACIENALPVRPLAGEAVAHGDADGVALNTVAHGAAPPPEGVDFAGRHGGRMRTGAGRLGGRSRRTDPGLEIYGAPLLHPATEPAVAPPGWLWVASRPRLPLTADVCGAALPVAQDASLVPRCARRATPPPDMWDLPPTARYCCAAPALARRQQSLRSW